jgi:hypothetical protein
VALTAVWWSNPSKAPKWGIVAELLAISYGGFIPGVEPL